MGEPPGGSKAEGCSPGKPEWPPQGPRPAAAAPANSNPATVLAVVAAKPSSNVGLLADGTVSLTAFIPNDRAFREPAHRATGKWLNTEEKVFNRLVAKLGVDAIESALLYHVVPGASIMATDVLQADGAKLATALPGASITVDVVGRNVPRIILRDLDRNSPNARVNPWQTDINEGNKQVAHGITKVLRPLNLRG